MAAGSKVDVFLVRGLSLNGGGLFWYFSSHAPCFT